MYTVSVETTFCAVHRVRLPDGTLEPLHGHDWRVRAFFAKPSLDDAGMVVDFEAARSALDGVTRELHHADLNTQALPAGLNPTAEVVARFVFEALAGLGLPGLFRVEVTEAPGCIGAYEAEKPPLNAEKGR